MNNRISNLLMSVASQPDAPQIDLDWISNNARDRAAYCNVPIFVVNGVSGSGKSTFESLVKAAAKADGDDVLLLSMAADVKDFCAECLGWDGGRDEKSRKLLADIISALSDYKEVPKLCICNTIFEAMGDNINGKAKWRAIFIDARELKDIEWFEHTLKALSVYVQRDNMTNSWSNEADKQATMQYPYELYVRNNGTLDDLRENAIAFYNVFIKNRG